MCIAIVKPKFAEFPTTKQFRNCFTMNPHGAGFMYSNGENLVIKKGFMTFEDFINAFEKENISKDKLVFFHFRIATHGLIDGGNTHPFPVSNNILVQRSNELAYKGYGLIHNGVIKYDKKEFVKYDPQGIISDTMLLSMKIKENIDKRKELFDDFESAIVYNLYHKDCTQVEELINEVIGYNKVAIMNEHEEYVKYGKWIEDNGVYYSNDDYEDNAYAKYFTSNNDFFADEFCCYCGEILTWDNWRETTIGDCCIKCIDDHNFTKCKDCGIYIYNDDEFEHRDLCEDCSDEYIAYCEECNKNTVDCLIDGRAICNDCYDELFCWR